eukprot:EC799114.1.p1 GENE.EC799114.1~~EC799114.1.p1  ORF type:complete len:220 (+),score=86.16 EC799114.1:31-690(+)
MAATDRPQVELVEDSDSENESSDDEEDLEGKASGSGVAGEKGAHKQSRTEKKTRKLFSKLGLKKVDDIVRVTIKKAKEQVLFVVSEPEVLRSGDTYVVFGQYHPEDLKQQAAMDAAKQFSASAAASAAASSGGASSSGASASAAGPSDAAGDDAGEGLREEDIELVKKQAKCDRANAIRALRSSNGDIVNAIMALTTLYRKTAMLGGFSCAVSCARRSQ